VIIVISVLLLTVLYSVLNCEFLNKTRFLRALHACGLGSRKISRAAAWSLGVWYGGGGGGGGGCGYKPGRR